MKPLELNISDFPNTWDWYNDQFPPLDALTYWHFLKKAKRVIEVGCGYSTLLPHIANVELTAIDPQPRIKYEGVNYIEQPVQNVSMDIFKQLEAGDILFVDSSHIYAEGSDVKHIMDKVIRELKYGVLIHFHDYFGEDGYPEAWKHNPEMSKWNENDYVQIMDKFYHTLADNYLISQNYNGELKEKYPFVPTNIKSNMGAVRGASIWFVK